MAYKETVVFQVSGNSTQASSTRTIMDTITLQGAGNISIGLSDGKLLFSSPTNYLTTAALSNHSHAFATTTTTGASIIVGTTNSNGVTIGVPSFLTTAQAPGAYLTTAALSNHSHNFATTTTNGASIIVATTNSNGATIAVPAYLTTAALSNHSHNLATTTTNGSLIVVATTNSNGATFAVPPYLTTAQAPGAYLTTARASTDGVGLNTAQTNVTWTVNSSGISINASGYAGTGLSLTNATATLNSNGLQLSVGGGGVTNQTGPNIAAGTQTGTSGTIVFANSNNITFGMSGSTQVTASFNPINIGMSTNGNTAGTTGTFDGAGLQYILIGGNNITLSQSANGSSVSLSIVGPNAGGGANLVDWNNFGVIQTMNLMTNLTATGVTQRPIFFPMEVGGNLTWNRGMYELSKVTNSQDYAYTFNFGIYSFANSTSINLIASLQNVYNISSGSSASATGIRRFAFTGIGTAGSTLAAGHYVGMMAFSATATSGMNASLRGGVTANPPVGLIGAGTNNLSTANLSSIYLRQFRGLYTTTTAVAPAAVALSHIQGWTSGGGIPYVYLQST
jgi:hypothetical protein